MSSSERPCGACKFLRRKCKPDCVFAPHFPPDQIELFKIVNGVFGTSNVAKILRDLSPELRADAVQSLVHDAIRRTQDRVYGCPGDIFLLQHTLKDVNHRIDECKNEQAWLESAIQSAMLEHSQLLSLQPQPQNLSLQQFDAQGMGPPPSAAAPTQHVFHGGGSANGVDLDEADQSMYYLLGTGFQFPQQQQPPSHRN